MRLRQRRRRNSREGSAAIEFAFVAIPFFLMIFSILELGIVFVLDSTIENAAIDTSRLIRTGQAQTKGLNQASFKSEFCSRMVVFENDCAARTTVDVRVIPQFNVNNVPDPISDDAIDPSKTTYDGGKAGDLVLVRIWYEHPLFTPFLSQSVSRIGPGKVLLGSATAFRNEPF
jgi:Flp pilus assembly protein TadG